MEKGWTKIFGTGDEYLATIAKDLLANSGIEAVVINRKDSSYVMWGESEVYVCDENKAEATEILNQIKQG